MVPTLYLFDRFDERLGILPAVGAVTHTEELGGEDTVEFDCLSAPEKGEQLLWRDPTDGVWREHVVVRTDEPLGGPAHVYAESSLCELLGDFVEEIQLVSKTAAQALSSVLGVTRWSAGEVGVGDAARGCLLYHVNALAALRRVEEVWGGEAEAVIAVSGRRVASRTVRLPARRGAWRGARFSYGKTLAACTRTVLEDEVFTALYGYGKGLPIYDETGAPTGGFTRRLTFGSVNGGANWVGDDAALLVWGRPDGAGGKAHRFGHVVFPDCEDATELKALTLAALAAACEPRVSYEVDVAAVDGGAGVRPGDDVAVIDSSRSPEWHLRARCVRRVRELGEGEPAVRLTLGTVERTTWAASADVAARVTAVEETAATASDTVASYEDLGEREF
ncbi:phage tail spike protein [Paratractidigestivibacter faecalis]|uniref:phage tail spike protein n=1 Tax=Paratractidigestivibacter faecalis TaxID=2292441 RepID=UPI003F96C16E